MNKEKSNKLPLFEIFLLALGELIVSSVIIGVFLLMRKFTPSVVFGALLGSCVVILNFIWLSISVNRAIDRALAERPCGELDDEALAAFTAKHTAAVQNASKLSYVIRTATTLVTLILAFLLDDVFNVIATLIPLLMLTPILTIGEFIKRRLNR